MKRVIIAGGRNFSDSCLLVATLSDLFSQTNKSQLEICTGGANGADWLGKQYAMGNEIKHTDFPADWDQHGKAAGYRRNCDMALWAKAYQPEIPGWLVAFWDGKSKGTGHMINIAKDTGLDVRVIRYV